MKDQDRAKRKKSKKEHTVVLSEQERIVILNSLAYMVQGGLTGLPIGDYLSAYAKLKDPGEPELTYES
jgi:hypothetical protein